MEEVDLDYIWLRTDNLSTNGLENFQVQWDQPDLIIKVMFPEKITQV